LVRGGGGGGGQGGGAGGGGGGGAPEGCGLDEKPQGAILPDCLGGMAGACRSGRPESAEGGATRPIPLFESARPMAGRHRAGRRADYSNLREAMASMTCAERSGLRASAADRKERVVRAVADGQPLRAAARRVHVGVHRVQRALVQERATGALERNPIPGCPRRLGPEQEAGLRARREAAREAPVVEPGAWWA